MYALPYIGNMQALTVSPNVGPLVSAAAAKKGITWKGVQAATASGKFEFYNRLGSDNGALIDFLPILWSYGGCLIGKSDKGFEVSGFTAEANSAETAALDTSIAISVHSSPEYSRFDENMLFNFIAGRKNLLSISWLASRGESRGSPKWYQMPVSEAEAVGVCAGSEERANTSGAQLRSGGLGLWSLAVEHNASNPELAREFIRRAVLKLNDDPAPPAVCSVDGELEPFLPGKDPFHPSPLVSKMSDSTRKLLSRARPRLSHPAWRSIEKAVGLRVREAHWRTIKSQLAACRAREDVQKILNKADNIEDGPEFVCPTPATSP